MTDTEIPERIAEMMREVELENMRERRGWATGTVREVDENGDIATTYEDAWIELFNGEGSSPQEFGGVRFMWADDSVDYDVPHDADEGYAEGYAHATREAAVRNSSPPYFFVKEFDADDVDYGQPSP